VADDGVLRQFRRWEAVLLHHDAAPPQRRTSYPGVVLRCRAVAVMYVEQNRANHDRSARIRNDRIFAVPEDAQRERLVTNLDALTARLRDELEQFAIAATALEGKDVSILGWGTSADALALLSASLRPQDATSAATR
jgi:inorganic pyrophosphatase